MLSIFQIFLENLSILSDHLWAKYMSNYHDETNAKKEIRKGLDLGTSPYRQQLPRLLRK